MATDKEIAKSIREWQNNECEGCAQPLRDCLCEVYEYSGTITFKTNVELTAAEIDQLIFALSVQIEEPADSNGDDEEFTTSEVLVTLEAK